MKKEKKNYHRILCLKLKRIENDGEADSKKMGFKNQIKDEIGNKTK